MASGSAGVVRGKDTAPLRARILKSARELFYRDGIHTVSVDAIAEAAGTNKTTLYRHFDSKDELVAECLREVARELDRAWAEIEQEHPGAPKQQLLAWFASLRSSRSAPTSAAAPLPTQPSN